MHDTQLYFRVWVHRANRLGKPGEPIHGGDENVLHAPVFQFRQHRQPEFRSFRFCQPQPE